jgi:hypothetical protein
MLIPGRENRANEVSRANREPIRIERLEPTDRMDSMRAAAHAATSPRVWTIIGMISGWGFAAAVYVAGTARQSDLVTLKTDLGVATAALDAKQVITESHATEAGQRAMALQNSSALAFRAITGLCARSRGTNPQARDREETAAQFRYDQALTGGLPIHDAMRKALQ